MAMRIPTRGRRADRARATKSWKLHPPWNTEVVLPWRDGPDHASRADRRPLKRRR